MDTAARHARPTDEGFSLVEVVVAMLVLTGALLALIPVQTRAVAGVAASAERQQATGFAHSALERVRATASSSTDPIFTTDVQDGLMSTQVCSEASGCPAAGGAVAGTAFTTRLYVSQPTSSIDGLVTLTAVTTWTSTTGSSIDPRVTLKTRMAPP